MPGIGDYELNVRLALRSEIDFVDEPLVLLRHHEEHYFNDDVLALTALLHFFEKMRRLQVAPHMEALVAPAPCRGLGGSRQRIFGLRKTISRHDHARRERAVLVALPAMVGWRHGRGGAGALAAVALEAAAKGDPCPPARAPNGRYAMSLASDIWSVLDRRSSDGT